MAVYFRINLSDFIITIWLSISDIDMSYELGKKKKKKKKVTIEDFGETPVVSLTLEHFD